MQNFANRTTDPSVHTVQPEFRLDEYGDGYAAECSLDDEPSKEDVSFPPAGLDQKNWQKAQKKIMVGRLSGHIGHDLKNLLTVIQGNAELLDMQMGDDPDHRMLISQIIQGTKQADSLTRQLMGLARKESIQFESLDMHELIKNVGTLLEPCFKYRIRMEYHLHARPSRVKGNVVLLRNALLNLALNAGDAISCHGHIIFQTEVTEQLEEAHYRKWSPMQGPCYLLVRVHDNGEGMDSRTLRDLFKPFYTTKSAEGLGLGLASVARCIKMHRAGISVRSTPQEGTTFEIALPVDRQGLGE